MFNPGWLGSFRDRGRARRPARGTRGAALVPGAAIGILRGGVVTTASYGTARRRDRRGGHRRYAVQRRIVDQVDGRHGHRVLADTGRLSLDDPVPGTCLSCVAAMGRSRDRARPACEPLRAPVARGLEFGFAATGHGRRCAHAARRRNRSRTCPQAPSGRTRTWAGACWGGSSRPSPATRGRSRCGTTFRRAGMTGRRSRPVRASGAWWGTTSHPVARWRSSRWSLALRPSRSSVVSTVTDLLRFAALHLEDASLAALRAVQAEVSIHGWLDAWCLGWARFEWAGGAVWGWDGYQRRAIGPADRSRADAAVVLLTNGSTGRALYRTLFAELMDQLFGISVPPLRLDPSPGSAGDLARFAGVYGWPDREIEVTADGQRPPACGRRVGKRRRSRSMTGSSSSTPWIRTTPP